MAISRDDLMIFDIMVYGVVVPLLLIIGLCGNVLTFIILVKKPSKTSAWYLLIALTSIDTLYLTINSFSNSLNILQFVRPLEVGNFKIRYLLPLKFIGWTLPSLISYWIIVIISIERFIAVIFPFKAKQILTRRNCMIAICVAVILPTASTCTRFVQARGIQITNNVTNETTYGIDIYFIPGLDKKFYSILRIANTYLLVVTPVILVMCTNMCTIMGLYCSNKKRLIGKNSGIQKRDARVSRMLLSLCVMFCLCVCPYAALSTYITSNEGPDTSRELVTSRVVKVWMRITYMLLIFNSSMNFIVYAASSSSFRNAYKELLCKCCCYLRPNTRRTTIFMLTGQPKTTCKTKTKKINRTDLDINETETKF